MTVYPEDSWVVSMNPQHSLIVRRRSHLPAQAIRSAHPDLVTVTWRYGPEDSGLPDPALHSQMSHFDDAIERWSSADWFIDVAAITGGGRKEWRFYARDAEEFAANFKQRLAPCASGGLVIEAFADPDWTALSELLPSNQ